MSHRLQEEIVRSTAFKPTAFSQEGCGTQMTRSGRINTDVSARIRRIRIIRVLSGVFFERVYGVNSQLTNFNHVA
jgi:hypothetical protein